MSTANGDHGQPGHIGRAGPDPAERLRALVAAQAGLPSAPEEPDAPPPGPLHWPSLPADLAAQEWAELAAWVTGLRARFPAALDEHVIPACWWRHNGHVEALAALRDHEAESYSPMAPASAAVAWLRALRDVAALLHAWTAELGCAGGHHDGRPAPPAPSGPDWDAHVAADEARRLRAEHTGGPQ